MRRDESGNRINGLPRLTCAQRGGSPISAASLLPHSEAVIQDIMTYTTEKSCQRATDSQALSRRTFAASAAEARLRFLLLGADYENSNLGIRAMATGALTAIDSQYPEATVHMVEYGVVPREFVFGLPNRTTRVEMLNIRFSKKLWVRNHIARLLASALLLKLIPWRNARRRLAFLNPWLQALEGADYVLSLSYGDSFSDIYGLQRFFYVSLPQILALLLGKRLVQLPQTIGPFERRVSRLVAKGILSRSTLVYTRDEEAISSVRTMVPASHAGRVRFCPDLALVVPSKLFAPADLPLDRIFSCRPVVGFNVSGLLWMGGYTRKNMFGLAADYKTLVRKAIDGFIRTKGATVLLVPHVNAKVGEGDPIACDEIFREFQQAYPGRLFAMKPPYTEQEVKHVIAQCDFFVGARMHACIAALSQCIPTAALAYSDKFVGVLRSVGVESSVADLRRLSTDEALARLASSFDSRESLKAALQRSLPAAREKVLGFMSDLNAVEDLSN
jgi:colanic acid/amylovoran biosynthesis protein WcaK/AmsJ